MSSHGGAVSEYDDVSPFVRRHLESLRDADIVEKSTNTGTTSVQDPSQENPAGHQNKVATREGFHKFLQLPQELQDTIWKHYICLNPRIIPFPTDSFHLQDRSSTNPILSSIPILQVSQRLRELAILEYEYKHIYLALDKHRFYQDEGIGLTFHPSADMIYITDSYELKQALLNENLTSYIRNLALGVPFWGYFYSIDKLLLRSACSFPALELLFMVISKGDPQKKKGYDSEISFIKEKCPRIFRKAEGIENWCGSRGVRRRLALLQAFQSQWFKKYGGLKPTPRVELVDWAYRPYIHGRGIYNM